MSSDSQLETTEPMCASFIWKKKLSKDVKYFPETPRALGQRLSNQKQQSNYIPGLPSGDPRQLRQAIDFPSPRKRLAREASFQFSPLLPLIVGDQWSLLFPIICFQAKIWVQNLDHMPAP